MPLQPETSPEAILDRCIDCLLAGEDWRQALPADFPASAEVTALMRVAASVARAASGSAHIQAAQQVRIWNRVESRMATPRGRLRAIALYRLPYLPPLWIRPEAM